MARASAPASLGSKVTGSNCAQGEQEGSTCSVELYNSLHGYGNACSGYGALLRTTHKIRVQKVSIVWPSSKAAAPPKIDAPLCGPKTFTSIGVATDLFVARR